MPQRSRSALLSRRQFECLQGVADLLDSAQIADRLGISVHTVNSHLVAAVAALGASSRRDAVRKYLLLQAEHPDKVTGQFLRVAVEPYPQSTPSQPAAVKEDRPPSTWLPPPPPTVIGGENDDVKSPLRTIVQIIGIAVGLVLLALATDPLVQSAMRLANAIQPYHHK